MHRIIGTARLRQAKILRRNGIASTSINGDAKKNKKAKTAKVARHLSPT